jgi:alanyl-tRNA synthetase
MKFTGLNELRGSFLTFFQDRNHTLLKSAPLIPEGDSSVLLINAGMTPLKRYFQGLDKLPGNRATSCQKCIRTPDIENVGITERHGTYFEMLGNFSFGDYFKEEAIAWGWEYLTKALEIEPEKLWITIFEEDDEAGDIWHEKIGIPRERIVKMGREDNFWEHGSGPCGPCSEIHFDRGEKYGCGKPDCRFGCENPGCNRYVEIWNLVFTQFDSDGKGHYTPLAAKNIDTGMGLERLALVMQDAANLFEVDTIKGILNKASEITGKTYKTDPKADISLRIITDHLRSSTFMVCDGILPSNEGRGYVLRRLLRRAARHARMLGCEDAVLYRIVDTVIDFNTGTYPELETRREHIKQVIKNEEESFAKTVETGMKLLNDLLQNVTNSTLSGEDTFKLHDTYGFPLDLTKEICAERGIAVDEEGFRALMRTQRETARAGRNFKGGWDESVGGDLNEATVFTGYDSLRTVTKVAAVSTHGDKTVVVLEESPFYAESGGQVGDTGMICIIDGSKDDDDNLAFHVTDTKKNAGGQFILSGEPKNGKVLTAGDEVAAIVDMARRQAIMRNHTAAHLLQAALRKVLGNQVHQAGSYVDDQRLRFDFTYTAAMTSAEIAEVETIVNEAILADLPVATEVLPIEEARTRGATALFGEKYGDTVRVVSIGQGDNEAFSVEFCGGTHLKNTAKAGLFKIISEAGVAGGVRRIEAVTGMNVLAELNDSRQRLADTAGILKTNPTALTQKAQTVMTELFALNAALESANRELAKLRLSEKQSTEQIGAVTFITAVLEGFAGDGLRQAADGCTAFNDDSVLLFAGMEGDKANFFCKCGKNAVAAGIKAGETVKTAANATGGKGGGKPDSAMAGIGDVKLIAAGFEAARGFIKAKIGG